MFNIGEILIYRNDLCEVVDIKHRGKEMGDYYVIIPLQDKSLKIEIPIANDNNNIRKLMTKEEIEKLINDIPNIPQVECEDKRFIENKYKELMSNKNPIDLIRIIKTTYINNKKIIDSKIAIKNSNYFSLAEKYLYQEIAIVLNMEYEDVKAYVISALTKENV
jgi:CarD family transcriptional regulator